MHQLKINTPSRQCAVTVGEAAFSSLPSLLKDATTAIVVTDENVAPLYGQKVCEHLYEADIPIQDWTLPVGEQSKSLWQAECLYDFLASKEIDGQAALVALGGGVVGDLAGFVAGTWHRGITWIACPTTLLAAVDAAIGGKTGLNHAGRKNCVGVFHQPKAVLVDTRTLATLDDAEFLSGMAESLKHGLIADAAFFEWQVSNSKAIRARQPDILEQLIVRNIDIKARIVEQDERDENGERAILNFGHTIGHAIEAASSYQLAHGACVAIGIMGALEIAVARQLIGESTRDRVRDSLEKFSLPTKLSPDSNTQAIHQMTKSDKKYEAGVARFVLPTAIGKVTSGCEVSDEEIGAAIGALS